MNCEMERQKYMFNKVMAICDMDPDFEVFTEVSDYYKKMINLMRQMNYSNFDSDDFKRFENELEELLAVKEH